MDSTTKKKKREESTSAIPYLYHKDILDNQSPKNAKQNY